MIPVPGSVREIDADASASPALAEVFTGGQPVVVRGWARRWPLVEAGLHSPQSAMDYLRGFYSGRPVQYSWGPPDTRGRPFYTDDFRALNCEVRRSGLGAVLDEIGRHMQDPHPPTIYVASLPIEGCLPGLRSDNDLDLAALGIDAPPSIWIGNRITASCHYDAPSNIACSAVGRRRFTLFPPEQVHNLYPGPLEPTPGGQAVSVVDFDAPDLQRYPRFRDAMASAQRCVLEPGDALYIPSLWWHHVQGLDAFTVLVNYWWNSMPAHVPTPMHALYHAMWTIRDRPEREKQAWRELFDYYVFGPAERAGEHLPETARNLLGSMDEALSRQLRAMLIAKLNR